MTINIGETIKHLRKEKNITQETLADFLSVTNQSISKWERGEAYPDITFLPAIASFFGTSVESVVLLVKLPPDDVVNIELDLTKLPVSIHDGDATYDEIKKYVLSHHGLKVSSLYISQIKRKYGLKVTEAYNKPKSENAHQPQCPPEKEKAIMDVLKHFGMI